MFILLCNSHCRLSHATITIAMEPPNLRSSEQWLSNLGPWASNTCITWEFVRNAHSSSPTKTNWMRNVVHQVALVSPLGGFDSHESKQCRCVFHSPHKSTGLGCSTPSSLYQYMQWPLLRRKRNTWQPKG
jgi:hypothetical protein